MDLAHGERARDNEVFFNINKSVFDRTSGQSNENDAITTLKFSKSSSRVKTQMLYL